MTCRTNATDASGMNADALIVAAVETSVPALAAARDLLDRFHRMLRERDVGALVPWAEDANGGLLASFGKGVRADLAAIKAARTEPWSNGQTEGQITKLKLVKCQMYGRADRWDGAVRREDTDETDVGQMGHPRLRARRQNGRRQWQRHHHRRCAGTAGQARHGIRSSA